jgi:hypothetical protein
MTRRDLLNYLLATPLAATVDFEQLLWVPEKTIFLPSPKQIEFMGCTAMDMGDAGWVLCYGPISTHHRTLY